MNEAEELADLYEDDCFQFCEARGCEGYEAVTICEKCMRSLCGRHAGEGRHNCDEPLDDQLREPTTDEGEDRQDRHRSTG